MMLGARTSAEMGILLASVLQPLASSQKAESTRQICRGCRALQALIIEHSILFAALSPAKLRRCVRAWSQRSAGLCTSARSGGDASPRQDVVARLAEALKQDAQPKTKSASRTDSARGRSKACRGLSRGGPQKRGGQGDGRGAAGGRSEDDASADRWCFRARRAASTTTSAAAAARVAAPRALPHESTQRTYGRIVTGRARRGRADA